MKQKREESGLSLRAVADIVGRHHSVVGKMEQDRRKIELMEFVAYCEAIGADPHEGLSIILSKSWFTEMIKMVRTQMHRVSRNYVYNLYSEFRLNWIKFKALI